MEARAMLKAAGLYCTAARLAVVDSLVQASGPIKPSAISAQLGTRFDRVTVYRSLDSLVHADLVHKVFIEERACHYELAHRCSKTQCHPHFTCTRCGHTHCLTQLEIPMAQSPHLGFIVRRQQVRLEGLCPDCA